MGLTEYFVAGMVFVLVLFPTAYAVTYEEFHGFNQATSQTESGGNLQGMIWTPDVSQYPESNTTYKIVSVNVTMPASNPPTRLLVWDNTSGTFVGNVTIAASGYAYANLTINQSRTYYFLVGNLGAGFNFVTQNSASGLPVTGSTGLWRQGVACQQKTGCHGASALGLSNIYSIGNATIEVTTLGAAGDPASYSLSSAAHNQIRPGRSTNFSVVTVASGYNLTSLVFSLDNGTGTMANVTTLTVNTNGTNSNSVAHVISNTLNATIRYQWFVTFTNSSANVTTNNTITAFNTYITPNGTLSYTNLSSSKINLSPGNNEFNAWDNMYDGIEFEFFYDPDTCTIHGYEHKAYTYDAAEGNHFLVYINGTNATNLKFQHNTSLTSGVRTLGMARDEHRSPIINGSIHMFISGYGGGAGAPIYHYKTVGPYYNFTNSCGASAVLPNSSYNTGVSYNTSTGVWKMMVEVPSSGGTTYYTSTDGCTFVYAGRPCAAGLNCTDPWVTEEVLQNGSSVMNVYSVDWTDLGAAGNITWRQGQSLNGLTVKDPMVVPPSLGWGNAVVVPSLLTVPNVCKASVPHDFYLYASVDVAGQGYGNDVIVLVDLDNRSFGAVHGVQDYPYAASNTTETNTTETPPAATPASTGLTATERSLIALSLLCGLLFFGYTAFTNKLEIGVIIILAVAAILVAVVIGLL